MTDRPILFSAPMVRAILEGRKTQTRRVIKPQPINPVDLNAFKGGGAFVDKSISGKDPLIKCPYGKAGDSLWVRETHALFGGGSTVIYAANWKEDAVSRGMDNIPEEVDWKWTPSIHMPRLASRITLEITSVRVERLQDISEQDALAEGMTFPEGMEHGSNPVDAFRGLWQSINGPESWDANPWVWVIEFKRVQP